MVETPDTDAKSDRAAKSWVGSRYVTFMENGQSKRRCKYANCGKEYSCTTSHMILKRHWSRDHQDIYSLSPKSRSMLGSTSPSNLLKRRKQLPKKKNPTKPSNSSGAGDSFDRKTIHLNTGSSSTPNRSLHHTPSASSGLDKIQFDVRQVSKRLKEAPSIHLSVDLHTPKKVGKTFGIITAHTISDSFELKSVLLEYRHLPYPDDPVLLSEFVKSCMLKFNCKEKIIGISTSESEVILKAVQEIDKRQRFAKNYNFSMAHFKCFPYLVHSNVNDVLRTQDHLLDSMRKVVNFINNNNFTMKPINQEDAGINPQVGDSHQQSTVMATAQVSANSDAITGNDPETTKMTGLKLPIDGRYQWSSTYIMIDTFLQQRGFIEPTLLYFQNSAEDLANIQIDWDRLFLLVHLLKPFYQVINRFSIENSAPISAVFGLMPHLIDHLSNSSWLPYEDLAMAAHDFKLNLICYRDSMQSDVTNLATVLDPRIKLTFVAQESRENMIDALRKRLSHVKLRTQAEPDLPEQMRASFPEMHGDEIDDYLASPRAYLSSKLYPYWECHKYSYPGLYGLARTLACIQATSVPAERMFAAADITERERKMQLDSTNSRELMKSWNKFLDD